jgi:outer membrane protein assembly factor BamD (BamD/ComL family)
MAAYEATAPSASSGARQNDAAQREARLIGVARETLQAHDPQGALVLLEDGARRFPSGILLQEREALSISALAALGRTAEASARARAFLKNFPSSPHAERVRAVLNR